MATGFQKDWSANQTGFRKFLNWLDGGVDSGGEKYLEVRRRLIRFFDRKNCPYPDDLADETLNRVARRFAEHDDITDTIPERYCYIAARFVFLEHHRRTSQKQVSLDEAAFHLAAPPKVEDDSKGQALECLQRCLRTLTPPQQDLLIEYYRGEQREKIDRRRNLAQRLGLTLNALCIRASRMRDRLEECVTRCCARNTTVFPGSRLKGKEG